MSGRSDPKSSVTGFPQSISTKLDESAEISRPDDLVRLVN